MGSCFKRYKMTEKINKINKMALDSLSGIMQDSENPKPKRVSSEVGAQAPLSIKGIDNIFSYPFGISVLSNTWISLDELYEAIFMLFFVSSFKQIPSYFSCLGEFCDSVVLCSSRNVLWTARFHHPFHLRVGELVMIGMLVELMTFFMTKHREHTHRLS